MTQRILIVEDEPHIADALRFLLEREGYSVDVETDGGNAIDSIHAKPTDLVILDVMLPNRSGFDILRDLNAGTNAPPVLMLTAKGQPQDLQTAETLGATRFMTKPFSNADVVRTVRELTSA